MATKKIVIPKSIKNGFVYSGTWNDGTLGWETGPHISESNRKYVSQPNPKRNESIIGTRVFLCKVKLVPVLDKKGRPITKIIK